MNRRPLAVARCTFGIVLMGAAASSDAGNPPFSAEVVDQSAGDVKIIADIDGDGYPDIVLGGMPGEKLHWFHYPTWTKTLIAVPANEFTTDGAAADVDNDGDLDIVVPDGNAGSNILWFENPALNNGAPPGNPFVTAEWTRRVVGATGDYAHDIELADLDSDGRIDVVTRRSNVVLIFFQTAPDTWTLMQLSGLNTGTEGLDACDIDGDTHTDLVLRGVWVRNPGGLAARAPSNWIQHVIGPTVSTPRIASADVDGNGVMDVVFAGAEELADIVLWKPGPAGPTGPWTAHVIAPAVEHVHSLEIADFDRDGKTDVFAGQMHISAAREVVIYHNVDGAGTVWSRHVLSTGGTHNAQVGDIDSDGDFDIVGSNYTGNPPLTLWRNLFCFPDCDLDTFLTIADFGCFQTRFSLVEPYADCNADGLLNLADFGCFQSWFALGCP